MTALENINDAIAKLNASIDRVVAAWGTSVPESVVNEKADAINAQTARLDALVPPPPPSQ